jgi:hypothetical protein
MSQSLQNIFEETKLKDVVDLMTIFYINPIIYRHNSIRNDILNDVLILILESLCMYGNIIIYS